MHYAIELEKVHQLIYLRMSYLKMTFKEVPVLGTLGF